jgi:hypothetical protein
MNEIPMIDWGLVLSVAIAIVGAKVAMKLGAQLWSWAADVVYRALS